MTIYFHEGDLPHDFDLGSSIAVDSETMGLNPLRDRLCLVQISAGDGDAHIVRFMPGKYSAPNLKNILGDPKVLKILHFARFDIAAIYQYLNVIMTPVYCTKIASKLVRTYTDRHGLKDLCRELIGVELDKVQQSSDWGNETISDAQKSYAASDVLYLHRIKVVLDQMLEREGRTVVAHSSFDYLTTRAKLDLMGFEAMDIFAHK